MQWGPKVWDHVEIWDLSFTFLHLATFSHLADANLVLRFFFFFTKKWKELLTFNVITFYKIHKIVNLLCPHLITTVFDPL